MNPLSDISNAVTIANAQGVYNKTLTQGEYDRAKSLLHFGNGFSIVIPLLFAIGGILLLIISMRMAFAPPKTTFTPPEETGMPSTAAIIDETGYLSDYTDRTIRNALETIAQDYHIQAALYASTAPLEDARAVYGQFFSDEKGLVLYLEDRTDDATLTLICGEELARILTPEVEAVLQSKAADDINHFSTDHAFNAVLDVRDGFHSMTFIQDDSFSRVMDGLSGVFLFFLMTGCGLLCKFLCCKVTGIPSRRKDRMAMLTELEQMEIKPD